MVATTFNVTVRAITSTSNTSAYPNLPLRAFISLPFFYTDIAQLASLRLLTLDPFVYISVDPDGAFASSFLTTWSCFSLLGYESPVSSNWSGAGRLCRWVFVALAYSS